MAVDILFRGGRRHQGHVVKRGCEDPAVRQIQAQVTAPASRRQRLPSSLPFRGREGEVIFGPRAELGHVPGQIKLRDVSLNPLLPAARETPHVDEVIFREQVGERQGDRPGAEHIAGERSTDADPLDERLSQIRVAVNALGVTASLIPQAPAGTPPPTALPIVRMSGSSPRSLVDPPVPRRSCGSRRGSGARHARG